MENFVNPRSNFFKGPYDNFIIPAMRLKIVFSLLLFITACTISDKATLDGKVIGISDGDTFTLLTNSKEQVKIRLYGIDCPKKAQDYGSVARQGLSNLIFGQQVRIDKKDTDRYGRTVALVFNNKGVNINEELLREGLAWHYKEYDKNPSWDGLEAAARQKRAGLWAQSNPTPPWLWRKRKREAAE